MPSGTSLVTFDLFNVDSYVDRTLAKFCAEVVYAVAAEHEISVQRLREWLERTFITPRGMRRIIAEGADHTARMPNSLVRDLVDRHLLTAEWSSAKRWYSLTNDRLVSVIRQLNIPSKDEIRPVVDAVDHLRVAERSRNEENLLLAEKHAWHALKTADDADLRLQSDARSLLGNIAFAGRLDVAEEQGQASRRTM